MKTPEQAPEPDDRSAPVSRSTSTGPSSILFGSILARRQLVLASQSPRRSALLEAAGLSFITRPANVDESLRAGESPSELTERLATAKATFDCRPNEIVLGADTVVVIDGEILGKPRDDHDAARMLTRLAGRTHQVYTGIALATPSGENPACKAVHQRTEVRIATLSEEQVGAYVATSEPADKAGAYAIQGVGSTLVEHIEGSYSNVVGLPMAALRNLLLEHSQVER